MHGPITEDKFLLRVIFVDDCSLQILIALHGRYCKEYYKILQICHSPDSMLRQWNEQIELLLAVMLKIYATKASEPETIDESRKRLKAILLSHSACQVTGLLVF